LELMIILALPIMVGGFILAPRVIYALYPASFSPAILTFQILMLSIFFLYISRPFGDLIVVSNQQRKFLLISVIGAVINIILNFVLIPKYSLYGAALATVIAALIVFLFYIMAVKIFSKIEIFSLNFLTVFISAVVSTIIMYLVLGEPFIRSSAIYISITIGTAVYLFSFLGIKSLIGSLNILNYGK